MVDVYPYTEWRGISWERLGTQYASKVNDATSDIEYLLTMKDFVEALHDGRCQVSWNIAGRGCSTDPTQTAKTNDIGQGYGVIFGEVGEGLDRGVSVIYMHPKVYATGLHVGDTVTHVNGIPVYKFLTHVHLRWAEHVPATGTAIRAEELRFMSRAQTYADQLRLKLGSGREVVLNAMYEERTFSGIAPYRMKKIPRSCISHRIIPASIAADVQGYMQVGSFSNCVGLAEAVNKAIEEFKDAKVKALIVDLRGNDGGDEYNVPNLLQFFYDEPFQYAQSAVRRAFAGAKAMDNYEIVGDYQITKRYMITPAPVEQRWHGKVVVLINRGVQAMETWRPMPSSMQVLI